MFGPLAGKVKLKHCLFVVAVISMYSVSAGYKEAPLKKEPASKPESQDRTPVVQDFRYSNVTPRDGLEGSTLYCTWRGNWFFFLENRHSSVVVVHWGVGADGGGGRPFPCFFVRVAFQGWEEALREGAYCTQEKTALKRWGGWWRGRPGTTQTTQPISFVFCNHDAQ